MILRLISKNWKTCMDDSQWFWSMFITLNWVTLFLSNSCTTKYTTNMLTVVRFCINFWKWFNLERIRCCCEVPRLFVAKWCWKFLKWNWQNQVAFVVFFSAKFLTCTHAHAGSGYVQTVKLRDHLIILCKSDDQAIMVGVFWCKTWRIFWEVIEHSPEKYLICQWLDFPSKIILTFLNTNKNMWTLEHLRKDLFTLNFEPEIIQENHSFGQDDSTMWRWLLMKVDKQPLEVVLQYVEAVLGLSYGHPVQSHLGTHWGVHILLQHWQWSRLTMVVTWCDWLSWVHDMSSVFGGFGFSERGRVWGF